MTTVLNTLLEITLFSAVLFGATLLFQKLFRRHITALIFFCKQVLCCYNLYATDGQSLF